MNATITDSEADRADEYETVNFESYLWCYGQKGSGVDAFGSHVAQYSLGGVVIARLGVNC